MEYALAIRENVVWEVGSAKGTMAFKVEVWLQGCADMIIYGYSVVWVHRGYIMSRIQRYKY